MADSPRKLVERWFEEVWNNRRREAIDELLAPGCVIHDAGQDIVGPDAFKHFFDSIQNTLSEVRVNPQFLICEGEYVAVRWVSTGKHKDTEKNVAITGMSLMRFSDGRAVEAWQNWDLHGMMQQIQAVPERAMAVAAG
jgi:predicted SnoaL-like aldol condensation-catalyzing enzyme